jgi:WhiB family redox-sensing transcriptional regulator
MHERAFSMTAFPATALPATGQSAATGQADWRELSSCRQEDPELFFPLVPAGPGLAQIERAKAVCARCQVRAECLRFAMETVQDHGVWGGASEEERRALRRSGIAGPPCTGQAGATGRATGWPRSGQRTSSAAARQR